MCMLKKKKKERFQMSNTTLHIKGLEKGLRKKSTSGEPLIYFLQRALPSSLRGPRCTEGHWVQPVHRVLAHLFQQMAVLCHEERTWFCCGPSWSWGPPASDLNSAFLVTPSQSHGLFHCFSPSSLCWHLPCVWSWTSGPDPHPHCGRPPLVA